MSRDPGDALKPGANVDEVLESCDVAVSIGGGGAMTAGETTRVMRFPVEKGLV